MSKIIFFGNQKLVQGIKADITPITDTLQKAGHKIIATIQTKEDLSRIPDLLKNHPDAVCALASFGHIVPEKVFSLFEPLGILNIHPSLLPKYRGSTPIESAILNGDTETGVSIMKIVSGMDSGPIYTQETLQIAPSDNKFTLAEKLTTLGANALLKVIADRPTPKHQTGSPSFTAKLDKSMSSLTPDTKSAITLDREVRAYLGFPKSKYVFFDHPCTLIKTHVSSSRATAIDLKCIDGNFLVIDTLQPESRLPMTATEFIRGYVK